MDVCRRPLKVIGQRKNRSSQCLHRKGLRRTKANGPRSTQPLRLGSPNFFTLTSRATHHKNSTHELLAFGIDTSGQVDEVNEQNHNQGRQRGTDNHQWIYDCLAQSLLAVETPSGAALRLLAGMGIKSSTSPLAIGYSTCELKRLTGTC